MMSIKTKMISRGAIFYLGALVFIHPAHAVEYFQLATGKYKLNYRAENVTVPVTEFRYGNYLSRAFALEVDLTIGSGSSSILHHGTTYDISNNPTTINWLGRDSDFSSSDVDIKLNNTFGVYGSYRWILNRFDLAARVGLVQVSYNQTFHARDAIINGVQIKTYKEEIGGADLGLSFGLSAVALVSDTASLVGEWQLLPQVGDSVRNGDITKVSAYSFRIGARFLFQ